MLGKVRINPARSLRDLQSVDTRHALQLMAVVLRKKRNNVDAGYRPRLYALWVLWGLGDETYSLLTLFDRSGHACKAPPRFRVIL